MNEINVVPFIDVMLVLLIIFMVTAPLITPGVVDLPTRGQGQAAARPGHRNGARQGRKTAHAHRPEGQRRAHPGQLPARVKQAQAGDAEVPVVISAERNVKYEAVVKVMDMLQREGVQRVGLSVKQGGAN